MNHDKTFKEQLKQKTYDFSFIKKCVFELLEIDDKKGLVVSGGIVPYLIMNKESNRRHENIDFLCKEYNIGYYRNLFLKINKFPLLKDSLNNNNGDYGFVFNYKDVPIGIYPFYEKNNCIYEKNFYYYSNEQFVRIIKDYTENDYVFKKDDINYMSLEVILKKKLMQNRPKDQNDIKLISAFGVNIDKVNNIEIEEVR